MASSWVTPRTWVTSEVPPAATWNIHVRDNLSWLGNDAPYCRLHRTTTQSLNSGAGTAIAFDSELLDQGGMHSTSSNTERITVPAGMGGVYAIGGCIEWATNATGTRYTVIRLNGSGELDRSQVPVNSASFGTDTTVTTIYRLAAGDYVELVGFQNSGGALNVATSNPRSPSFWCHWLRN